jgi:formylglycine-generating enzyme required for sulfatase activity
MTVLSPITTNQRSLYYNGCGRLSPLRVTCPRSNPAVILRSAGRGRNGADVRNGLAGFRVARAQKDHAFL